MQRNKVSQHDINYGYADKKSVPYSELRSRRLSQCAERGRTLEGTLNQCTGQKRVPTKVETVCQRWPELPVFSVSPTRWAENHGSDQRDHIIWYPRAQCANVTFPPRVTPLGSTVQMLFLCLGKRRPTPHSGWRTPLP